MTDFLRELKRRRVLHTVSLYVVGAWVALQVVEVLSGAGLPPSTMRNLLVILSFGFPIALVAGWFFDISKNGITKTRPLPEGEQLPELGFIDHVLLIGLVLVVAIDGYILSFPSPENAQLLKQMFSEVDDPEVREQILFALTQMPGAVDGDWLVSIFANENEEDEVREMALFMAGQTGSVDARVLSQMYDSAGDNIEMKQHILFTLTQVDSDAAFDKMLEIARTEEDPELREHAIFWIGQSGDPRAQDVLLEILNQ